MTALGIGLESGLEVILIIYILMISNESVIFFFVLLSTHFVIMIWCSMWELIRCKRGMQYS